MRGFSWGCPRLGGAPWGVLGYRVIPWWGEGGHPRGSVPGGCPGGGSQRGRGSQGAPIVGGSHRVHPMRGSQRGSQVGGRGGVPWGEGSKGGLGGGCARAGFPWQGPGRGSQGVGRGMSQGGSLRRLVLGGVPRGQPYGGSLGRGPRLGGSRGGPSHRGRSQCAHRTGPAPGAVQPPALHPPGPRGAPPGPATPRHASGWLRGRVGRDQTGHTHLTATPLGPLGAATPLLPGVAEGWGHANQGPCLAPPTHSHTPT